VQLDHRTDFASDHAVPVPQERIIGFHPGSSGIRKLPAIFSIDAKSPRRVSRVEGADSVETRFGLLAPVDWQPIRGQ
jgi:hypothetical protein